MIEKHSIPQTETERPTRQEEPQSMQSDKMDKIASSHSYPYYPQVILKKSAKILVSRAWQMMVITSMFPMVTNLKQHIDRPIILAPVDSRWLSFKPKGRQVIEGPLSKTNPGDSVKKLQEGNKKNIHPGPNRIHAIGILFTY